MSAKQAKLSLEARRLCRLLSPFLCEGCELCGVPAEEIPSYCAGKKSLPLELNKHENEESVRKKRIVSKSLTVP
jgi:hypothetical protein